MRFNTLLYLCTKRIEQLVVTDDINHTVHNHFLCLLGQNDILDTLNRLDNLQFATLSGLCKVNLR